MAAAFKSTRIEIETVKVEKIVDVITLKLSAYEADTLANILGRVGGNDQKRRDASDAMADALDRVGHRTNFELPGKTGDIYFNKVP